MMTTTTDRPDTWRLDEGDRIAPGLTALRLLGGGTRYEAYLAFDDALHHVVVVKVLRPNRVDDAGAIRGLRGEADVLDGVNHPAIARMFRSGVDADRPHVVLELVEGPRLSTLIRRYGRLAPEQAGPLAVEIASALHYLHGLDVVHLDVKPKNVMMAGPARLIDLSVARSSTDARTLKVPVGTDAYMAPEQIEPERGLVGAAADVWGLGVTLGEALLGRALFPRGSSDPEATPEQRWPQLVATPAALPGDMEADLRTAVDLALAPDPADRPSARDMASIVEPLLLRPPRMRLNNLKPR
jgi:serine/threonine-protein kinase